MAYWVRADLENALGPKTVMAIFDDENDGTVNDGALVAVQVRSDSIVNSYIATVYPKLTLPLTSVPDTVKFASLEYGLIFARDRAVEYWSKQGEGEREFRLKEARKNMAELITATRVLYDSPEPKPATVGGFVTTSGPRTFVDGPNGEDNLGDF